MTVAGFIFLCLGGLLAGMAVGEGWKKKVLLIASVWLLIFGGALTRGGQP